MKMDEQEARVDWWVWTEDAKEAIRDGCTRQQYEEMHKPSARQDAARAYDAVMDGKVKPIKA